MNSSDPNPMDHNTNITNPFDFGIDPFVDDMNFDHLVGFMRGGEPPAQHSTAAFSSDHHLVGGFGPASDDLFNFNSDPNAAFLAMEEDAKAAEEDDEDDDDDDETENSSGATASTTPTSGASSKKPKLDRTRTLVSERKRRGRMKEKLYALRALVPNITKMDKASIVGDAVLYVQDLQKQAKNLRADIADLESSLKDGNRGFNQDSKKNPSARALAFAPKIITLMDVFHVEEEEFYVRMRCHKGHGVAASLYRALESLSNFVVRNSNLTTTSDRFVLTFTVNAGDCHKDINLASLKIWITTAFVNQGFAIGTA